MSARSVRVNIALLFLVLATAAPFVASSSDPAPAATPSPTLIFVAELCRHGDRSPIHTFPSDTYPVSKWPEGKGQLTAIGQRAHYDLGSRLRAKYVDSGFLSSSYKHTELYVRSSDVDRTLMSAAAQLTGLYPPGTPTNYDVRVKFGKDPLRENEGGLPHLFQPIPIHTQPRTKDMMLLSGRNCPRHDYLMRRKLQTSIFLDKVAAERDFIRTAARIAQVEDVDTFSIFDVDHLCDTWTCFKAHSVPLPKDATPDIVEHACNISNWMLTYGNKGREIHRLRAGLILDSVARYMAMASLRHVGRLPKHLNGMDRKFLFLSAHDNTVASTLAALRVFNNENPPYNSTIFWELYSNSDGSLSVRLEFNGNPLVLPGCPDAYCPIDDYMRSTSKVTIPGEDARWVECQIGWRRFAAGVGAVFYRHREPSFERLLHSSNDKSAVNALSFGVVIFITVGVIAIVGILSSFYHLRRNRGYDRPEDLKAGDNLLPPRLSTRLFM